MNELPEIVDGLPNLCGNEREIERVIAENRDRPVFLPDNPVDFTCIKSAYAVALHMHSQADRR